jgi:hypothetical protein
MSLRKTVQIPIHPWFKDHHFNGHCIFPAVESMLLLAGIAKEIRPDIQRSVTSEAVFSKFLPIPEDATTLQVLVDIDEDENGISLKLLSKIKFKKISRIKEHAELFFSVKPPTPAVIIKRIPVECVFTIDAKRIYEELVPFGPAYRSLTGALTLSDNMAGGTLRAPKLAQQHEMEKEMGSPFPLDGAMHAACVMGQCIADFVPFPIGFASRTIHKPTQAGETYNTIVSPKSAPENELIFNLSICDTTGIIYETIKGLRMRDVSRGTIRPPQDLPRLKVSPQ